MTGDIHRYSLPDELEPDLGRVQAYWNGLKRGANDVPFWDDFRFDLIGADVSNWYGGMIDNRFLDEIVFHAPFDELTLQCKATVEGGAPTYYCQPAVRKGDAKHPGGYARLLLPLWGNGRVEMLLGAVVPARKRSD